MKQQIIILWAVGLLSMGLVFTGLYMLSGLPAALAVTGVMLWLDLRMVVRTVMQ